MVYRAHIMRALSRRAVALSLRLMLRPIVRFCLRHALKAQEFGEIARSVFFDVAREEMLSESLQASTSRLSVRTGLTRREVARLLQHQVTEEPSMNLLTRVIGKWQSHPDYTSKKQGPRALSVEGKDSEFAALVQSVSQDLNPYTVLFELERIRAVKRDKKKVRLMHGVYVPEPTVEEGFRILSRDVDNLVKAVEGNVINQVSPPHLHIKTHYDNIALSALAQIRTWLLEEGTKFHARAREYLARFDKDLNPRLINERGGGRVTMSAFSFTEAPQDSTQPSGEEQT